MQTLSQQSPAHRTLSTLLCPKIYLHLLTNLDNIHCVQERANREREIDKQTGRESFDTYDTYKVVPPSAISWFIIPSNTNRYIYSYLSVIYIYINEGLEFHQTVPHCGRTFGRHRFDVHSILLHFLASAETRSSKEENPIYTLLESATQEAWS